MNTDTKQRLIKIISKDMDIRSNQVEATLALLAEGATVPFIARYRKEATGGLSDTVLRELDEKVTYLDELITRQNTILKSINDQGKLTDQLKKQITSTESKTRLEDLYAPFKPKRRTKAQIAKEAGLEPLVNTILENQTSNPSTLAQKYLNTEKNINTTNDALDGARHILAEKIAEDADVLEQLRALYWQHASITSTVHKGKESEGEKFSDYFEFSESINKIPSHRLLAVFRGQKENVLQLQIQFIHDLHIQDCFNILAIPLNLNANTKDESWLWKSIVWTWKIKLKSKMDIEILVESKHRADEDAIKVFRDNMKNLLMAAPAGNHVVLGLDPGFRSGVKTVVVDGTGKLLEYTVIYPHAPQKQWDKALNTLSKLCLQHKVKLISIGNGTASRETNELAAALIKSLPKENITSIVVSEAGASVYSASALAAKEFPELDVTIRGAISIARRLQDPLSELVKIDPKSIGVGQYQHDVSQLRLGAALNTAMEDCVNAVGADINTASIPLLSSISGLNETVATNIVQYREEHGRFKDRASIKQVPRLGAKTYEQAAGFLRVVNGTNILDSSSVHPESYSIVKHISKSVNKPLNELISNESYINQLNAADFVNEKAGLPTIQYIFNELKKPGRDPRPEFVTAKFSDGINAVSDLTSGMELEGVITNVANFGAFVDIGVHQDGLVHVSQIADHFVKDLHKEIKVGQIVKVRVLEVDKKRKRISLTMKKQRDSAQPKRAKISAEQKQNNNPKIESALASQLKDLFS